MAKPTYFATEADFRGWLEANHKIAPELLVGFWKKNSDKASIDWPQARDQALCFGWIDGIRRSLGDEAYTIRFTPRRKGSIWSKVNVERFNALSTAGQMMPEGVRAYEENKHKSGLYSYENERKELTPAEQRLFSANKAAWADWDKRPAGLPQDGAALGHERQASRNPRQAPRAADRRQCRGATHRPVRLA